MSNQVAIATGTLTEWICNKGARLPVAAAGHATTVPPAGGAGAQTGDYVAVPTQGEDNEKVASIAASLPPRVSAGSRALEFIKRDLRVKFGALMLGLWILNEICESPSILSAFFVLISLDFLCCHGRSCDCVRRAASETEFRVTFDHNCIITTFQEMTVERSSSHSKRMPR